MRNRDASINQTWHLAEGKLSVMFAGERLDPQIVELVAAFSGLVERLIAINASENEGLGE